MHIEINKYSFYAVLPLVLIFHRHYFFIECLSALKQKTKNFFLEMLAFEKSAC